MQFQFKLQNIYFDLIKNGKKTIELRLYDNKRKNLKIDDEIIFINNNQEELLTKIIAFYKADSFEHLLKKIDIKKTGFDDSKKLNEALLGFYDIDEQNKFGVLGIEIEFVRAL